MAIESKFTRELRALRVRFGLACCVAALAAACHRTQAGDSQPASTPATTTSALKEAKPETPQANPPARAGGLSWNDAPPLVRRTPKSSMRAAEYGLADEPRAELAVFYFGPDQGGSVDANVARWLAQFTQPDGSDTNGKAKREKKEVGGIPVTFLEVSGAYSGGMGMPGGPAPEPIADAMLLGAIAEGPAGPVFFKLTGPRASIEHSRAGFEKLLGSLHK